MSVISETAMALHFIINIFNNHRRLFEGYNCPLGWTFNITGQRPLLFSPNSTLSDWHKGEYPKLNIKAVMLIWGSICGLGRHKQLAKSLQIIRKLVVMQNTLITNIIISNLWTSFTFSFAILMSLVLFLLAHFLNVLFHIYCILLIDGIDARIIIIITLTMIHNLKLFYFYFFHFYYRFYSSSVLATCRVDLCCDSAI